VQAVPVRTAAVSSAAAAICLRLEIGMRDVMFS